MPSTPSATLRRIAFIPAILLVLAVGYSLLWLYGAHRLEDGFKDWARIQSARGTTVEYSALAVSGYPGIIRLAIAAPHITAAKTGWQWAAERANLETRAWTWQTYRVDVYGTQQLGVPFDGAVERLTARSAATFVIARVNSHGRVAQAAFQADGLHLSDAAGTEILSAATLRGTTQTPAAKSIAHDQTSLDLTLQASDVLLGSPMATPLGKKVERIDLAATIKGALPGSLARDAVDAWRRDGGTVELDHFTLNWGALDLRANGTMALDERLRPLGAISAEISGYGETLGALEQARVLPPKTAEGSRFALDLLSRPDGADGRRVVTVPLSAQNGSLYLGPLRIVRLAAIPFPAR